MQSSILIVGAGPTGVVLALSLALNGVNARLIEKDAVRRIGQRGAGIQARTQEMHHFLGTAPDILSLASQLPQVAIYTKGSTVPAKVMNMLQDLSEQSDAFPTTSPLVLGQDKHVEILIAHFKALGGKVEQGTELVSFEQFPDHVTVCLKRHEGDQVVEETAKFDYLVGTDGAHSQVRKQLGLGFVGETRQAQRMLIGDMYIRTPLSRDLWHMWGEVSTSFLSLRPVKETPGLFFVMISGSEENLDIISDRDAFINCIRRISGIHDLECGEQNWLAIYTPNIRMVDLFRKDRGFVAGDAAHVHSPAGGQGLNSGAQDAFNLGWKLSLVAKGLSKPSFLDSYSAERLPVIAEMLQVTSALHGKTFNNGTHSESTWKRGGALDQLGVNYRDTPFVLDEIPGRNGGNWNRYDQRQSGEVRAGDRAPDASGLVPLQGSIDAADGLRMFDIFGATVHTVLLFHGSQKEATSVVELLRTYPSGLFKSVGVLPSASLASGNTGLDLLVEDQLGNAYKAYRVPKDGTTIIAVRPDGVVGAMVADAGGLRRYLDLIFV